MLYSIDGPPIASFDLSKNRSALNSAHPRSIRFTAAYRTGGLFVFTSLSGLHPKYVPGVLLFQVKKKLPIPGSVNDDNSKNGLTKRYLKKNQCCLKNILKKGILYLCEA